MKRVMLLVVAALALGGAAPRDWSLEAREEVAGWSFGRAAAPVRLTEYLSFGCPHCGHFTAEAGPAIKARVKAGSLAFDVRPFLIFPQDRAAAALVRCTPARNRLGFIEAVMAEQGRIRAALDAADADDVARGALYQAELAGPEAHAAAIARATGLDRLAAAHGLNAPAAAACLADPANHAWVSEADLQARVAGIQGTPTFILGGERLGRDLTPAELAARIAR